MYEGLLAIKISRKILLYPHANSCHTQNLPIWHSITMLQTHDYQSSCYIDKWHKQYAETSHSFTKNLFYLIPHNFLSFFTYCYNFLYLKQRNTSHRRTFVFSVLLVAYVEWDGKSIERYERVSSENVLSPQHLLKWCAIENLFECSD